MNTRAELDSLALKVRDVADFLARCERVARGEHASTSRERDTARLALYHGIQWSRLADLSRSLLFAETYR